MPKLSLRMLRLCLGDRLPASMLSLLAISVASCAAPTQYMGISLVPGAADAELQQLAQRARGGDQQAQLDLGIAFEEGRGVAINRKLATSLYRRAAKSSPSTLWVYVPSAGGGAPARVLPVQRASLQGLLEARLRLDRIDNAKVTR